MSNIAIGQLGMSNNFKEPYDFIVEQHAKLLIQLAKLRPKDTFWWCSVSRNLDTSSTRLFPNQNVRNALAGTRTSEFKTPKERLEKINSRLPQDIDLFLIFAGMNSTHVNNNETCRKPDGSFYKALVCFQGYCGPILHAINQRPNAKFIALADDPRSAIMNCKDLLRRPDLHLASTTWDGVPIRHFTSYEDLTLINTESSALFFPLESFVLLGTEVPEKPKFNERHDFGLILNAGAEKNGNGLKREPILREWVLSNSDPSIEVYGKWEQQVLDSDKRMKGFIHRSEIPLKLKTWKYTLCIPIQRGWSTTKYIEMTQNGVIPFLHPFYDEKRLIAFPEILRVQTPAEMHERMVFLDNDKNAYNELWDELHQLVFKPGLMNGTNFNEILSYVLAS